MRVVEWLLTENCNFSCEYCGLYNNEKKYITDKKELTSFLIEIKAKQLIDYFEFFIFGGEPFLHPEVNFIVAELNRLNIDYIFQTNLSKKSTDVIYEIIKNEEIKKINISVHSTQQSVNDYILNLNKLFSFKNFKYLLNNIEVMYNDLESIKYYYELKKNFSDVNIILCPVSDFLVEGFGKSLTEYNEIRRNKKFSDIVFEDIMVVGPDGKEKIRSEIWQDFIENKQSPKGKECLLKSKNFLMYDSLLNTYNCCFHDNVDLTSCPYDTCFLS